MTITVRQTGMEVFSPFPSIYANNDLFLTAVEVQLSISKAKIRVKRLAGPRWRSEGREYPGIRILNLCMNAIYYTDSSSVEGTL